MREFFMIKISSLPPTINNYYGRTSATVYKKVKVRMWQEETIELIKEIWHSQPVKNKSLELRIEFTSRGRRKWDIDNRIKPLQDCLEKAGVIENDNQIESLYVRRKYGARDQTAIILLEYENE